MGLTPRKIAIYKNENVYEGKPCRKCGNTKRRVCNWNCIACDSTPEAKAYRKSLRPRYKGRYDAKRKAQRAEWMRPRTEQRILSPNERNIKQREKYHEEYKRTRKKAETVEGRIAMMYRAAAGRAKLKKWELTITPEWIRQQIILQKGCCAVTKMQFNYDTIDRKTNALVPSLDRIDSTKSYTPDNTRVVAWWFNQMKNAYSDKQLVEYAKIIVRTFSTM